MNFLKLIKMLIACMLSIFLAESLHLNYAFSAGFIALLSISDTKKSTLSLAQKRLGAFLGGLSLSFLFFHFLGYSLLSFTLFLFCFLCLCMYFKCMVGLVPSCVLLSHLFLQKNFSWAIILNDFALLLIAIVLSTLLNLYMPSYENKISHAKKQLEDLFKKTFFLFYLKLTPRTERKLQYIPKETLPRLLSQMQENLNILLEWVLQEEENQLFSNNTYNKSYVLMRKEQVALLSYMMKSIEQIKIDRSQGQKLGALFYQTALEISEENSGLNLLNDLNELYQKVQNEALPQSREEFEDRAILYKLFTDFHNFIEIKYHFSSMKEK